MNKLVIGVIEKVSVGGIDVLAYINPMEYRTIIDEDLIKLLDITPTKVVEGKKKQLVYVDLKVTMAGLEKDTTARIVSIKNNNIKDQKFYLVIGRDILFSDYVIDVTKSHDKAEDKWVKVNLFEIKMDPKVSL